MKIIYLLLINLSLLASMVNMHYVGNFSVFGNIAKANVKYFNDGHKYHITVSGNAIGMVGYLTKHKEYIYESIGLVKGQKLIPKKYISKVISADVNETKVYIFDYKHNQTIVKKSIKKNVQEYKYDVFYAHNQCITNCINKNSTDILKKVYHNDMVSVLFNKNVKLLNMKKGDIKIVYAVGSNDTQDGIVVKLINIVNHKYVYSIILKKDYLAGGSSTVTFILDSNNLLYVARLDGILFFGNEKK